MGRIRQWNAIFQQAQFREDGLLPTVASTARKAMFPHSLRSGSIFLQESLRVLLTSHRTMDQHGRYLFAYGGTGIYRSEDSGRNWLPVADSILATNFTGIGPSILTSTSKSLYRSKDSGGTWDSVMAPISNIQSFAAVGTVIYAANQQLMKSTDSGATWSLVPTSFTVQALVSNGKYLFVGGNNGLYILDSNGSWRETGLKGNSVLEMCVFDTLLFAEISSNYDIEYRSIPEIIDSPSSVVEQTQPGDSILVYPNPATGIVTVLSGGTTILGVSVQNVLGQDVLDESNLRENNSILDISKLPPGTYFLAIQTSSGTQLRKVTIVR
jgi:Secretion system C-terminal sorting domain